MYDKIQNLMQDWIAGPMGFLRGGSTMRLLSANRMGNGESTITWRVYDGDGASTGTIIAYADEDDELRTAMYHGDDGLQTLWHRWHQTRAGTRIVNYPPHVEANEMTVDTAKAFGRALGMWAADQGREVDCLPVDDCVYVEESNIWDMLHREWFGDDEYEGHPNEPLYDAAFKEMYIAAKDRSREHMAMDDINRTEV